MRGWQKEDRNLRWWRETFLVCLFSFLSGTIQATVTSKVFLADANTPLEQADPIVPGVYRDIMVGTHLTIIISSDTGGEDWGGELLIGDPYLGKGLLSARDYNDITWDWQGSRFPEAGKNACVWNSPGLSWKGREVEGFSFQASRDVEVVAGDWFILDYTAIQVGQCVVEFTDYGVSFYAPVSVQVFSHVPTRDFDRDGKVCLVDFARLAGVWKVEVSADPNDPNPQYDLNSDGKVNASDLRLFFGHWLDTAK
jgi:hypothetical protein